VKWPIPRCWRPSVKRARPCTCPPISLTTTPTGGMFVKALVDARNRGVVVRVLVDAVGERYSKKRITRILKAKGVPCARFLPIRWNPTRLHLNLRNHRKLLVADSRVGFIGGMNIRDAQWADSAKSTRPICDMHFPRRRPRGPRDGRGLSGGLVFRREGILAVASKRTGDFQGRDRLAEYSPMGPMRILNGPRRFYWGSRDGLKKACGS
jgi:hypothetical protein